MDINGLTIGSTVFVVHKDYAHQNKNGGVVNRAKIVSFRNVAGTVSPELKIDGHKEIVNTTLYKIYPKIRDAIKAIQTF